MSGRRLMARAAKQQAGDESYAVLDSHRKRAIGLLLAETEALVGEGIRVEDVVWVLTPASAGAMLVKELIDGFQSRGAHELAKTIATVRAELEPGHCVCAYMGPEGHFFEWIRIDPIADAAVPSSEGAEDHANGATTGAAGFDAIAEPVRVALRALLVEHQFVPPLHAAVIGAGGGMIYLRFVASEESGGLDAQQLAEHASGGDGMRSPIQLIFTDTRGEAARVVIRDGVASGVVVLASGAVVLAS